MEMLPHDLLWLELAFTPEVQPRHLKGLLDGFGDIASVCGADHLSLAGRGGLPAGAAHGLASRAGAEAAEKEFKILQREGIALVTWDSPRYPRALREITDPPFLLFCKGTLVDSDDLSVALVGTRFPSAYGVQVAHRLAGDLAARGISITSGMANGIDQAAHNGALAVGGRTIAVLGSGLGRIYPSGTGKLVERIAASGAVISEFPFATPPGKGTFPQRNRIVSGMSLATCVIEAGERSGALITTRLALEQGREVLAVPGPIYAETSIGPNYLIKKGAKLVQNVADIIDELPAPARERLTAATETDRPRVDESESRVLAALSVDRPVHVDIIAAHLGMTTSDISLLLLNLEMKSLVKQLPGMEYVKAL